MLEDALAALLPPYKIALAIFARIDKAELREHLTRVGIAFSESAGVRTAQT